MRTSRQNRLLIEFAAVVSPVVLVYLGRSLLASPAPVSNTVPVSGPAIAPTPAVQAKPLTPDQRRAADWVKQLAPAASLVSPLNHPVEVVIARPSDPEVQPDPIPPPPIPRTSPILGLKLTGVLGNSDGQLAAINGKVYRIGQEVRPGIKLIEIDARNSRIVLESRAGEKFELKREQAELKN